MLPKTGENNLLNGRLILINGAGCLGLMCHQWCYATGGRNGYRDSILWWNKAGDPGGLTQLIETETMHERKQIMADMSDRGIALPGGCGTLEELLEIITWSSWGPYLKPVVILTQPFLIRCWRCWNQAIEQNGHAPWAWGYLACGGDIRRSRKFHCIHLCGAKKFVNLRAIWVPSAYRCKIGWTKQQQRLDQALTASVLQANPKAGMQGTAVALPVAIGCFVNGNIPICFLSVFIRWKTERNMCCNGQRRSFSIKSGSSLFDDTTTSNNRYVFKDSVVLLSGLYIFYISCLIRLVLKRTDAGESIGMSLFYINFKCVGLSVCQLIFFDKERNNYWPRPILTWWVMELVFFYFFRSCCLLFISIWVSRQQSFNCFSPAFAKILLFYKSIQGTF